MNKKVIYDAVTGAMSYVDETPLEIADREQRQAAYAVQVALETKKASDTAKIVSAQPTKDDVNAAKTVSALADQVAKQGELLALIAAKLGLI